MTPSGAILPETRSKTLFQRASSHPVVHNTLWLYVVHFCNYLVPLLIIPYLARVLGPSGWGVFAFVEACARYVMLAVEFGFSLSASREVARVRDSVQKRGEVISGVLGAQASMSVLAIGVALLARNNVEILRAEPALFWAALFWAITDGMNLMWYYQGLERMSQVAFIDTIAKTCALAGIFALVHRPADAWKVFLLRGAAGAVSTALSVFLATGETPLRLPSLALIWHTIRSGAALFLFRSATNLYSLGSIVILGIFVRPELVGFFAGAEKIRRAAIALLNPVTQALYPRISKLVHDGKREADQYVRIGLFVMVSGGLVLGFGMFIFAPLIVRILLGPGFEPAIVVLRVFCLLQPLTALTNMLGIQWMLPLGLDRQFNAVMLSAGVVNALLAVFLAPRFAQVGMAWAVTVTQVFVLAALIGVLGQLGFLSAFRRRNAASRSASSRIAVAESGS